MAIKFLDSFSHYGAPNIVQKWTGVPQFSFGSRTIVAAGGRCLQNALQLTANTTGSGDGPSLHLPYAGLTSGTMMGGYKLGGDNFLDNGSIFVLYKNGTLYLNQIASLGIQSNGTLIATRGVPGSETIFATSLKAIQDQSWHHIGWSFTIDPSAGRFTVYVDGDVANPWIDFTGNTGASGGYTDLSILRYSTPSGGGTPQLMCDFAWGDAYTDYKGDTRVYRRLPNADGSTLQWTPKTGITHYNQVNENPPDAGATYNSNLPNGNIDTYKFPAIGIPSGTVYAVQVVPMLMKDNVGFRGVTPVIRQGGVNYVVGSQSAISDGSFLYYPQCFETDPLGAAWTVDTASNDEFGVKQTG
jgi:hypothetical protein